jgi:hypothetical protein
MTPTESAPRIPTGIRLLGTAAILGVVAVQLTGCSSTIEPGGAAESVAEVVSEETGFEPTDVTCPSGVEAAAGEEFECRFTGPDGSYVAHVSVTRVDGEDAEFFIETEVQR